MVCCRAPTEELAPRSRKKFDVPELSYNLNLLLDMTEEEIIRNDRQTKFLKVGILIIKELYTVETASR